MKWRQMNKRQWFTMARTLFCDVQSPRKPCEVCGLYGDLTEAHHIVPLIDQWLAGFDTPIHAHAWLCPTHHKLVHKALKAKDAQAAILSSVDDKGNQDAAVLALVLKAKAAMAACRTRLAPVKTMYNDESYTLNHYANLVSALTRNRLVAR